MSGALAGRCVVITGAARGVGKSIAEACARQGADLVIADVVEEGGREAAEHLQTLGQRARYIRVDLSDPSSVQSMAGDIAAAEGRIDGLVNNAALATGLGGRRFEEIPIEVWDRVMKVNVRGTWLVTRALSSILLDNRARIVNIASDTALWGADGLLAYVASKGAVVAMTRSLARELGPRGIGVVGLAPGLMRNEATEDVAAARHAEYEARRAVPGPQYPSDISDFAAFALTQGALALTGQVIPTNAGFHYV